MRPRSLSLPVVDPSPWPQSSTIPPPRACAGRQRKSVCDPEAFSAALAAADGQARSKVGRRGHFPSSATADLLPPAARPLDPQQRRSPVAPVPLLSSLNQTLTVHTREAAATGTTPAWRDSSPALRASVCGPPPSSPGSVARVAEGHQDAAASHQQAGGDSSSWRRDGGEEARRTSWSSPALAAAADNLARAAAGVFRPPATSSSCCLPAGSRCVLSPVGENDSGRSCAAQQRAATTTALLPASKPRCEHPCLDLAAGRPKAVAAAPRLRRVGSATRSSICIH